MEKTHVLEVENLKTGLAAGWKPYRESTHGSSIGKQSHLRFLVSYTLHVT